jgi:transposase
MNLHLAEIATEVAPGKHAILMLDQAGWHLSSRLIVPSNITILPLPAKCPELNPQENVWQFMRDNWLSNRVFKSYEDIVDHCCFAWNRLIDQPWRIIRFLAVKVLRLSCASLACSPRVSRKAN